MSSKRRKKRQKNYEYNEDVDLNEEEEGEEEEEEEEEEDDEEGLDLDEDDAEEDDEDLEEEESDEEDEEEGEDDEEMEEEEEGEDDEEGDEEEDEEEVLYDVQYGGVDGDGIERKPGDLVQVKCANCALWNRAWAGEVHCSVNNEVEGEPMRPQSFSCGSYFWPFDRKELLDEFLDLDAHEALMVKRIWKSVQGLFARGRTTHLEWMADWMKKNDRGHLNPIQAHDNVMNFIHKFASYEDVDFPAEFIPVYGDLVAKRYAAIRRNKGKPRGFRRGDLVEWTNRADGARLNGIIFRVGGRDMKGKLTVVCTYPEDHDLVGTPCTFVIDEWQQTCDPKINIEAKDPKKKM